MEGRGSRLAVSSPKVALLCCGLMCVFSLSLLLRTTTTTVHGRNIPLDVRNLRRHSFVQEAPAALGRRRELVDGPGSYPPRCLAKCGDCTPCNPVHVAVPPGSTPVITEYYPEAWRCKCGNKFYVP